MDIGLGRKGQFDNRVFLSLAEKDADGGIFLGSLHLPVEIIHIHLHLPQVLVVELVKLEIDQHVAAQQPVVEDEIDEKMIFIESKTLLPGLEKKPLAEFKQKLFEPVDDGTLQVGLGILRLLVEAEEFKDIRFLEQILGLDDDLPFVGKAAKAFLVPTEGESLIKAGRDLAFQLT